MSKRDLIDAIHELDGIAIVQVESDALLEEAIEVLALAEEEDGICTLT